MTQVASVDDSDDIGRLLRVLGVHSSRLVNWSGFGAAIGLTDKTTKRYTTILETPVPRQSLQTVVRKPEPTGGQG